MGGFDVLLRHPNTGRPVRLHQVRHQIVFPGSHTWVGQAQPGSLDELVFTVMDGALAGVLRLDGGTWSVSGSLARPIIEPEQGEDSCGADEVTNTPPLPLVRSRLAPATRAATVSGGPYDSAGLPVVDILAVYGDAAIAATVGGESSLRAKIVNDVADLSNALAWSSVQGRVRLVGMEWIDWNPSTLVAGTNKLSGGATKAELVTDGDGVADDVFALRERFGADVVIGMAPPFFGDDGVGWGGVSPIPVTPSSNSAAGAYTLLSVTAMSTSLAHELGHQASLRHHRDEASSGGSSTCQDTVGAPRGRFGFVYPTDFDVPPGAAFCATNGFKSLMESHHSTEMVHGTPILKANYVRLNRFANPDVNLSMYCDATGAYVVVPTGSSIPNPNLVSNPADACTAEAAWRLNETWGAVSDYRPARAGVGGAELLWPTPGSVVSGSSTFWWDGTVSPLQTYWLQVYAPATGQVFFDQMVMSSGTYGLASVSGLPVTNDVLGVRLWTYLPMNDSGASLPQWTYKEFRYNSANKLVSCGAETEGIAPDPQYANGTCGGCYWSASSGLAYCSASSGAFGAHLSAVSGFVPGDAYDLAFWGQRSNGTALCCLMHDPVDAVNDVRLYGGVNADTLAFHDASTGWELAPYGQQAITAMLSGSSGNDVLIGSNSEDPAYAERLYGSSGDDELHGGAGNDDLFGGTGNDHIYGENGADLLSTDGGADVAYGGAGNDTLVSRGSTYTSLRGDTGSDVLCADHLGVNMVGSPPATGGLNVLYWSSTASGSSFERAFGISGSQANGSYSWCGHTSFAGLLSFCSWVTLSQAPTNCAAYGLPN